MLKLLVRKPGMKQPCLPSIVDLQQARRLGRSSFPGLCPHTLRLFEELDSGTSLEDGHVRSVIYTMKAIVIDKFIKVHPEPVPRFLPNCHLLFTPQTHAELHISEVPQPPSGHITVKVECAALNHVDLLYARGQHQNNTYLHKPPFTLGSEFAGVITSTGANATSKFRPGDRVFGSALGAFAESITADEEDIHKIPEGWSSEGACGLAATAGVSYGGLVERAKVREGEWAMITGPSGGLGLMAIQVAKAVGARIVAVVGNSEYKKEKQEVCRRYGANEVVVLEDGWEKTVIGVTGGQGVDVVYDSVGVVESSIRCLAHFGRVILIGFAGRGGKMEKVAMNRILLKQAVVIGYRFGETDRRNPEENQRVWKGLIDMIEKGLVKPTVYKETYHGLEDVPRAMDDLAARKLWGKAVVDVAGKFETRPKL